MNTYKIETRNRENHDWTVTDSGEAKSRRKFLHTPKSKDDDERTRHSELVKGRTAWRCRIEL